MIAVAGASRHATVVAEDQEVVEHRSIPLAAVVAVKLYEPKFSPVIVTDEPPDVAAFLPPTALTAGPSNVNRLSALVPTAALTVTFEYCTLRVEGVPSKHAAVVADVHAVVPHTPSMMANAVTVKEYEPKFSPLIVTDAPPDVTAFATLTTSELNAGASNVKAFEDLVPTVALTVSFALDAIPVVAVAGAQATVVPDVHAVVEQSAVAAANAEGVKS